MPSKHVTFATCSASIFLKTLVIALSCVNPLPAECPPLGLVTRDDYFVAGGTQPSGYVFGGTLGIEECGNFIVGFDAIAAFQ